MKVFSNAVIIIGTLPVIYIVTSAFPYPIHQIAAAVFSLGVIYCVQLNWKQE